jgi:hypothetical protein
VVGKDIPSVESELGKSLVIQEVIHQELVGVMLRAEQPWQLTPVVVVVALVPQDRGLNELRIS